MAGHVHGFFLPLRTELFPPWSHFLEVFFPCVTVAFSARPRVQEGFSLESDVGEPYCLPPLSGENILFQRSPSVVSFGCGATLRDERMLFFLSFFACLCAGPLLEGIRSPVSEQPFSCFFFFWSRLSPSLKDRTFTPQSHRCGPVLISPVFPSNFLLFLFLVPSFSFSPRRWVFVCKSSDSFFHPPGLGIFDFRV